MIDFLVNLALNLSPKTFQKSTQEASKIDKLGHSKHHASWLGIWSPLGPNLVDFGVQNGGQVGPKLAPKSSKIEDQEDINKNSMYQVMRVDATGGGCLIVLRTTEH